jgi:hypothetical protein
MNNRGRIPYNLKHDTECEFDENGNYVPKPGETGLNCATFVLTVFRSAGTLLVDTTTWIIRESPEREVDVSAQSRFVSQLARKPQTREQAERVRSEIGGPRIRPEEVAGACLEDDLPVGFSQCRANGQYILQALAEARQTQNQ